MLLPWAKKRVPREHLGVRSGVVLPYSIIGIVSARLLCDLSTARIDSFWAVDKREVFTPGKKFNSLRLGAVVAARQELDDQSGCP